MTSKWSQNALKWDLVRELCFQVPWVHLGSFGSLLVSPIKTVIWSSMGSSKIKSFKCNQFRTQKKTILHEQRRFGKRVFRSLQVTWCHLEFVWRSIGYSNLKSDNAIVSAVFRTPICILIQIQILGSVSDDYGSGFKVILTLWILFSLLNVLQCFFI